MNSTLQKLPAELILEITRYLDQCSLAKFAMSCRRFHSITTSILWSDLKLMPPAYQAFPSLPYYSKTHGFFKPSNPYDLLYTGWHLAGHTEYKALNSLVERNASDILLQSVRSITFDLGSPIDRLESYLRKNLQTSSFESFCCILFEDLPNLREINIIAPFSYERKIGRSSIRYIPCKHNLGVLVRILESYIKRKNDNINLSSPRLGTEKRIIINIYDEDFSLSSLQSDALLIQAIRNLCLGIEETEINTGRLFKFLNSTTNLEELGIYAKHIGREVTLSFDLDTVAFRNALKSLTKLRSFALGMGYLYINFEFDMLPSSVRRVSLSIHGIYISCGKRIDAPYFPPDICPWRSSLSKFNINFKNLTSLELHFYSHSPFEDTVAVLTDFPCQALENILLAGYQIPQNLLVYIFRQSRSLKKVALSTIGNQALRVLADYCKDIRELIISQRCELGRHDGTQRPSHFTAGTLTLLAKNCCKLETVFLQLTGSSARPLSPFGLKMFLKNVNLVNFYVNYMYFRTGREKKPISLSKDKDNISSFFHEKEVKDIYIMQNIAATRIFPSYNYIVYRFDIVGFNDSQNT